MGKAMRKTGAIGLALAVSCCYLFGCGKTGPIPNGKYAETPGLNVFTLYEGEKRIEFYWEIKGDQARYYVSAALTYKCNIVEENNSIYFEGYTWKSAFSSVEQGAEFKYEVLYDENARSITVLR